ncbi:Chromodomain helicase DNA binding protein [Entamoeba marina]
MDQPQHQNQNNQTAQSDDKSNLLPRPTQHTTENNQQLPHLPVHQQQSERPIQMQQLHEQQQNQRISSGPMKQENSLPPQVSQIPHSQQPTQIKHERTLPPQIQQNQPLPQTPMMYQQGQQQYHYPPPPYSQPQNMRPAGMSAFSQGNVQNNSNYMRYVQVPNMPPMMIPSQQPRPYPHMNQNQYQHRTMFNPVQIGGNFPTPMGLPQQPPPPSFLEHDLRNTTKIQAMKITQAKAMPPPTVKRSESRAKKRKEEKTEDVPTRKYTFRERRPSARIIEEDDEVERVVEKKKETYSVEFLTENALKEVEKVIAVRGSDNYEEAEYLVKYKGQSYRNIEWKTGKDLLLMVNPLRVKRWSQKKRSTEEEEYFPADYLVVERIISEKIVDGVTYYLVKWCGGLNYLDLTWEKAEELGDDEKIEEFKRFHIPQDPSSIPPPLPGRIFNRRTESDVYKHGNTLRSYQLEGLNWLVFNWCRGKGCILADEMGLGKTVQVVTFFQHLMSFQKLPGPFLIVTPLSTLEHWRREVSEWTDMNVIVYLGTKDNRHRIQHYEWFYLDQNEREVSKQIKFHALVTTYEMVLNDLDLLSQIHWQVLVVDEAQRLKNKESKLNKALTQVPAYHKILLTGTPIQNNITELWTLLNFVDPDHFSTLENFNEQFGEAKTAEEVNKLQTEIKPYLLRRVKDNVEKSIPPKEEILIEVELTLVQKKYYRALYEKNREFLNKGCIGSNVPHLQNLMIQLRKVCNHPFLIPGVEAKEVGEYPDDSEYYASELIKSSGKLVLLDKLLPKLRDDGHKVLIFSQLKGVLDMLVKYLKYKNYTYERLDGSIKSNDRQNSIDRFMKGERFVFLLCTRAGGIGINLSEADTVIIYDSDWNPQNDLQAQARCHRIGQKKEVKVYRLLSRNTYERYMFERASLKLGLDQAILSNIGEDNKEKEKLSKEDIDALLKYGAYGVLKEDDNTATKTSKVVWQGDSVDTSNFSKATFVSEAGDVIDLNDPNFWEQVLPKLRTPGQLYKELDKAMELEKDEFVTWLEENLEAFIMELRQHIDSVVGAYNEAKGHILPERDTILKSIELLLTQQELIAEDIVDELLTAAETLKFSRNKRKTRYIPVAEDEDDKRSKKLKKTDMSREMKSMLYDAIVDVGRADFKMLRIKAQIGPEWPQDEIRSLTIGFLRQCAAASDLLKVNKKYFTHLLEQYHNIKRIRRGGRDDVIKPGHVYTFKEEYSFVKEFVKRWETKLKYSNRFFKLIGEDEIIPEIDNAERLTNWWNPQCDHDLLKGFARYGFESGELIQEDEDLIFSTLLSDQPEKSPKTTDEVVLHLQYEMPSNKVLTKHIKSLISLMDKQAKKMLKEKKSDEDNEHSSADNQNDDNNDEIQLVDMQDDGKDNEEKKSSEEGNNEENKSMEEDNNEEVKVMEEDNEEETKTTKEETKTMEEDNEEIKSTKEEDNKMEEDKEEQVKVTEDKMEEDENNIRNEKSTEETKGEDE